MTPALQAARMFDQGDYEGAHKLAQKLLRDDPGNPDALFVVATCAAQADEFGTAIHLLRSAADLTPKRPQVWNNLGMCYEAIDQHEQARKAFQRAINLNPEESIYLSNMGQTFLGQGDPDTALKWCERALLKDPLNNGAQVTQGFAHLVKGEWSKGWPGYRAGLGGKFRARQDFGLPEWRGEADARVVVYFEQGLGDEILHASCVPDLLRVAKAVALDCDPRIAKVFRRSFPGARVFATRRDEKWWFDTKEWTHQIAAGDLFAHFRPDPQSCPRTPFLAVNPDYATMYRALIASHTKPGRRAVGLCWSGGNYLTNARNRSMTLESMRPLIEGRDDLEFFSLEYRDTAQADIDAAGLPVHHFRYAVGQGADFDHTLAFISCLDTVYGIHTTAHHGAGGIGARSMILVPENNAWLYGKYWADNRLGVYANSTIHRRGPGERWTNVVRRTMKEI